MLSFSVDICPDNLAVSEDWDIADPIDKPVEDVRRIRDEVRARVIDLLKEIQTQKRKEDRR